MTQREVGEVCRGHIVWSLAGHDKEDGFSLKNAMENLREFKARKSHLI